MRKRIIIALLDRYKRNKQNANDNSLAHCLYVAHHMLKKTKYCFLVTHGENGWCSARLVEPIIKYGEDDNFTIWVGTHKDLRKTNEVWSNPKVTITIENTREDANLIIYGNAFIETNPTIKKKHWKSAWRMFFPPGPEGEEYVAIHIKPTKMEIVSFSKNITPEPFGLKSTVLVNQQDKWSLG